jgi:hypothetical protein
METRDSITCGRKEKLNVTHGREEGLNVAHVKEGL